MHIAHFCVIILFILSNYSDALPRLGLRKLPKMYKQSSVDPVSVNCFALLESPRVYMFDPRAYLPLFNASLFYTQEALSSMSQKDLILVVLNMQQQQSKAWDYVNKLYRFNVADLDKLMKKTPRNYYIINNITFMGEGLSLLGFSGKKTAEKTILAIFTDQRSTACNASTLLPESRNSNQLDYLVSFPRSGSHMTQDLMEHYTGISPSTEWEGEEPRNTCYHLMTNSIFVKTHHPFASGNKHILQKLNDGLYRRIIWISRSVFSMLPSFHIWNYKFNSGSNTDSFPLFANKSTVQYVKFVGFWKQRLDKGNNVMIVKYEDINNKPHEVAMSMIKFLGAPSRVDRCGVIHDSFFYNVSKSNHSKVNLYGSNYLHFWCFMDEPVMSFIINATKHTEPFFGYVGIGEDIYDRVYIKKNECNRYKDPPAMFNGKKVKTIKRRG